MTIINDASLLIPIYFILKLRPVNLILVKMILPHNCVYIYIKHVYMYIGTDMHMCW